VPLWVYHLSPLSMALTMVATVEVASLVGLLLVRRFVVRRIRFHDGVNDAISGVVAVIGVFYGITVGLLAIGVWNTWANASELVSKEAAAIAAVHQDVRGYPKPARQKLEAELREYTRVVIEEVWPAQQRGNLLEIDERALNEFQDLLHAFEPSSVSQTSLHNETLAAFDRLIEQRRLRLDAVHSGLSGVMWAVIWVGAVISIVVTYLYDIRDLTLHFILVALMSGFLAIVIFTIGVNDKPFFGRISIPPDSYTLVLQKLIEDSRR
jgi:hypothetical protein